MALIGYARVSTHEQNLDLQRRALEAAACDEIFEDVGISATADSRPGFNAALDLLRAGDVLVMWKMDRAFRSLRNAMDILEQLEQTGVEIRCLTEAIDTTTPLGRCFYQIRNMFAELERNYISERTIAGMEAARARGARIGRPRKLSSAQVASTCRRLLAEPRLNHIRVAHDLGVSPITLKRAIARHKGEGDRHAPI